MTTVKQDVEQFKMSMLAGADGKIAPDEEISKVTYTVGQEPLEDILKDDEPEEDILSESFDNLEDEAPKTEAVREKPKRITLEDVQKRQESEDKDFKKKKRPRNTAEQRIAQVIGENKDLKAVLNAIYEENTYLKSKVQTSDNTATTIRESDLQLKIDMAKRYMQEALDRQDSAAVAEANDALAEFRAELRWVKDRKNQAPEEYISDQLAPYIDEYNTTSQYAEYDENKPENPYRDDWMSNNEWYDQGSPLYDHELALEADAYATNLIRTCKFNNRADLIGGPEFFNEISNYMTSKYGANQQQAPRSDMQQMQEETQAPRQQPNRAPIASPTRTPSNGAAGPKAVRQLNADEKAIAHATITEYNGKPVHKMEDREKIYAYLSSKRSASAAKQQRNY